MKLPGILAQILTPESRKVGFGWTLFIVSTCLLWKTTKIDAAVWQTCVLVSGALIGGGTIADKWLEKPNAS